MQSIRPHDLASPRHRLSDIQAHGRGQGRVESAALAGARVNQAFRPHARGQGFHVGAGAGARVKQPFAQQLVGRLCVAFQSGGLCGHLFPFQSQPLQITAKLVGQFGARPCTVDILDPQQKTPPFLLGQIVRGDRGIGVAEVQGPVGRGREARDHHCP